VKSDRNVRTTNVASKISVFGISVPQYLLSEMLVSVYICINHNGADYRLLITFSKYHTLYSENRAKLIYYNSLSNAVFNYQKHEYINQPVGDYAGTARSHTPLSEITTSEITTGIGLWRSHVTVIPPGSQKKFLLQHCTPSLTSLANKRKLVISDVVQ